MKKALLLLSTFALSSCITPQFSQYVGMVDFRPYMEEGFFVSRSNSVSFDYEPIGYVEALVESGKDKSIKIENKYKKEFEQTYYSNAKWRSATSEDAMKVIVEKSKQVGADALIDIEFKVYTYPNTGNISKVHASGMAIKRK